MKYNVFNVAQYCLNVLCSSSPVPGQKLMGVHKELLQQATSSCTAMAQHKHCLASSSRGLACSTRCPASSTHTYVWVSAWVSEWVSVITGCVHKPVCFPGGTVGNSGLQLQLYSRKGTILLTMKKKIHALYKWQCTTIQTTNNNNNGRYNKVSYARNNK